MQKMDAPRTIDQRQTTLGTPGGSRSRAEEEIVERLRDGAAPIGQFEGRLEEVRSLIDQGVARLAVSEYEWGVEFEVELVRAAH